MKTIHRYELWALVTLLLASSCRQEDRPGGVDGIRFSAETGYHSSTKTAYAGGTVADGAKERIDWVVGDQFKLACAQASPQVFSYQVNGGITASGALSRATEIVPVGHPNANGLQWGTGTHHFYAVYPATAGVSTDGVISATLPDTQDGSTMTNCLMWAGAIADANTDFTLRFTPMVTTFQFTVSGDGTGAGDIEISAVELTSSLVALAGGFSAQITQGGGAAEIQQSGGGISYSVSGSRTIPAVVTSGSGKNNSVLITPSSPVTINDATSYTFRVFVYPSGRTVNSKDVMDGLTVKYFTDKGNRSLDLKYSNAATNGTNAGQWVAFPAGRKINITGLQLPAQLDSWRFNVSVGDLANEISDIAVLPVEVVDFDN